LFLAVTVDSFLQAKDNLIPADPDERSKIRPPEKSDSPVPEIRANSVKCILDFPARLVGLDPDHGPAAYPAITN
jgi:hypothetical protein